MTQDEMTEEIFKFLGLLQRGPGRKIQELSQGEMLLLGYLVYKEAAATPTELSRHTALSTARVACTLNSLEKKSYVERTQSEVDRRRVTVGITAKGKSLFKEKKSEAVEDFKKLLNYLGDEDSQEFLRLLMRITAFMQGGV